MSKNVSEEHLILLSGGIDSIVLAHWAKKEGYNLSEAIFFNYGQDPVDQEIYCARQTALKLKIPLQVFDISGLRESFWGIFKSDFHILMAECNCGDPAAAYGIAATYGVLRRIPRILIGSHADDIVSVPKLKEFHSYFEKSISALHNTDFRLTAPFIDKKKSELINIGQELGVEFGTTWVCYRRGYRHCGVCSGCQKRKKAFSSAGIKDAAEYES